MHRTSLLTVVAVGAAIVAACESSNIGDPRAPGAASLARSGGPSSCTITLPPPANRPLPAVREVARELNEAFANPQSSVNCGIVTGIGARMNTLVSKLDQPEGEQNLDAACGIAGSLVNQLEALVANGSLDPTVTHPPEASGNVVENMDFIRSQFCTNAGHTSGGSAH
jgi:hypothetical protein